jgi:hypothetical protein
MLAAGGGGWTLVTVDCTRIALEDFEQRNALMPETQLHSRNIRLV